MAKNSLKSWTAVGCIALGIVFGSGKLIQTVSINTNNIEKINEEQQRHRERLASLEAYQDLIKKSLDRIEQKIDKLGK